MLKLGAINKLNEEYENVCNATKENSYKCPECESDVILRKGTKNRIHFAHKKESDCKYCEHPSESEIHKEGKRVIKMLLEKNELNICKECQECGEKEFVKIPEYAKEKTVKLEHSFNYDIYNEEINENGVLRIADVAYLNSNKEIIWICEILNTHKTKEEDRPEPWNEIEAKELLKKVKKGGTEIKCSREYICEKCYEKRYKLMDKLSLKELLNSEYLEWFIRYKLGQRNFKKYITEHLRICFDASSKEEITNNENIMKIFEKYYGSKKVIIETTKGCVEVKLITKEEIITENLSGCGTVEIIKYILENIDRKYVLVELSRHDIKYCGEINERIYLDVNYDEREKIKKKGGKWDIRIRKWYIEKDNTEKDKILKKYGRINVMIQFAKININEKINTEIYEKKNLEKKLKSDDIIEIVKKKLGEVKNQNQIKKYKKIFEICSNNEYVNFDLNNVILTDNEYNMRIIHPKTNKIIYYHLKYDSFKMPYRKRIIETRKVLYCIKKNIKKMSHDKIINISSHKKYGNIFKNIMENKIQIQENIDDYKLNNQIFNNENNENMREFMLLLNYYKVDNGDNDDIEFMEYIDDCIEYDWKIINVIEWLKSDGTFNRCTNCNCIYSYNNDKVICNNKYCKTSNQ